MGKFDIRKWLGLIILVAILITGGIIINCFHNTSPSAEVSSLNIDNGDLNINWEKYGSHDVNLNGTYTITESGTYNIYGTLDGGGMVVNADNKDVRIVLHSVYIKNPSGPAILCNEADNLVIELAGNNYLEDGTSYASSLDDEIKGTIFSFDDLAFTGDGSLIVVANYQDGIVSKDDLVIRSGSYNITAVDDAIRGKDSVYIVGGNIVINAAQDGIKSTNDLDTNKGFVYIENGDITITAGDDGIHAEQILIIENGDINIMKSYEGLEGVKITINNGNITVRSSDDGINAGGGTSESETPRPGGMMDADENCVLTINNGNIYVNAGGDGIDSNGYVYINGGNVVVDGPTNNGNGALDSGIEFVMNGGEAIAVGSTGMAETFGNKSTINNISVFLSATEKAGTKIEIRDTDNQTILEHTAAKTFSHIAAGSDKFITGKSYSIYLDDVLYQTLTIKSVTTVVGNSMNRAGAGGMRR